MTVRIAAASGRVDLASMAVFRAGFGLLMLISVMRFFAYGWIDEFYVRPRFHFTYWGFSWVRPAPEWAMYGLFAFLGLLSAGIMLGLFYRFCIAAFFLVFTYIELIDKTVYLNHYYLVSLLSLLMTFMPLHLDFSLDALRLPKLRKTTAPTWCLLALRMQVGLVYFFAGVAKLKADWLFEAQPLRTWLSANSDLPLVGPFLEVPWLPYAAAWAAAAFDLTVPFWLLIRRTRPWALGAVAIFHVATLPLFQLGLFPVIMIWNALLFCDPSWPVRIFSRLGHGHSAAAAPSQRPPHFLAMPLLTAFFLIQTMLPFRYLLYGNDVLWSEEGFRFSWNVMLMEKSGLVRFHVKNDNGQAWEIIPDAYLSERQLKMMATQPDMILQTAHWIRDDFQSRGIGRVHVYAEAYAALNGRSSRLMINPQIDLAAESDDLSHKTWITTP